MLTQLDLFGLNKKDTTPSLKLCYGCKKELPITMFRVLVKRHGKRHTLSSTCSTCDDMADLLKKEFKKTNPLPENYKCPLCYRSHEDYKNTGRYFTQSPFSVDHCQEKMVVRGWICNPCNSAMGLAQHDPKLLKKLASYLEETTDD